MASDRLKRKIPTCEDHAPTGCRYVESMVDGERFMLEQWGRQLKEAFGNRPYLVGSVMRGGAYRDVDVRMVSPKRWLNQPNVRRAINLSVSLWGRQVTGLPIDFQFQSPDEFAAETGIRSALGMMPAVWLNEGAKP